MKTRLRSILADRKISRKELADKTGVHYNMIRAIYNEEVKRLEIDDLKMLCEFLNCDISDLIYFEKVA